MYVTNWIIVLNDDPDLVGSFCVWLNNTEGVEKRKEALNGRWLSCKWDIGELEQKYTMIKQRDLLRFRMAVE